MKRKFFYQCLFPFRNFASRTKPFASPVGRRGFGLVVALPLILFAGCFDYEEEFYFRPDLSGTLALRYDIPLKERKDNDWRSMVASLPWQEARIRKKFEREEIQITRIERSRAILPEIVKKTPRKKLTSLEKMKQLLRQRGKVNIYLTFTDWRDLKKILAGEISLKRREGQILFDRELKGATQLKNFANSSQKRIYQYSQDLSRGHYFRTVIRTEGSGLKILRGDCKPQSPGQEPVPVTKAATCGWSIPLGDFISRFQSEDLRALLVPE